MNDEAKRSPMDESRNESRQRRVSPRERALGRTFGEISRVELLQMAGLEEKQIRATLTDGPAKLDDEWFVTLMGYR